jgi:transposase
VKSYGKSKGYLFKPLVAAAESILNRFDGIISFAHSRITNAFMEGLNSVFSAVKRKARGYRSNKNLIIMLYFVAGKLDIHRMQRFYLHH